MPANPVQTASPSRLEWLRVGQEMLRTTGATSIKLVPLVEVAGKTSGSFYHHYTGIPAFLDDLARIYGTDDAAAVIAEAQHADPAKRLQRLHRALQSQGVRPLDTAMRDWAGTFGPAAAAVEEFDATMFGFIEQAFVDLDFPRPDARSRALLVFGASVARMSPPWASSAKQFDEALRVLTSR